MNERIKQIAYEAGQGGHSWYNDPNCIQAFAELIVRQCAEVGLDSVEDGDDLDAIMKRVHNNILTHFGVEE